VLVTDADMPTEAKRVVQRTVGELILAPAA
jgi:hypothetical protein